MQSYIFKLKFKSFVRFGQGRAFGGLTASNFSCCADTLFSALCCEILRSYGEKKMLDFVQEAKKGDLLISDMFPWKCDELYLPKPIIFFKGIESNIKNNKRDDKENSDRKFFKNVQYIPLNMFNKYFKYIKTGSAISSDMKNSLAEQFAYELLIEKAAVGRDGEAMPYTVSGWRFTDNSGLYFIVRTKNKDNISLLKTILDSLGISGIGGKKSTGMGKFELAEEPVILNIKNKNTSNESVDYDTYSTVNGYENLAKMLDSESEYYMSLSVLSLSDSDFKSFEPKRSFYSLLPRTGFVYSKEYSNVPLKKKPVVMFAAGSCFEKPFEGDVIDLSDKGAHSVFRYGKGMYVGVDL